MYNISASMSTSHGNCTCAFLHENSEGKRAIVIAGENETDGASGDSRRYQTSPLIAIYYGGTIVSCGPC